MKKIIPFLLILILISSCESSNQNTLLPNIPVNEIINLSNPEFINLQVPGGWAYVNGGIKGIILYNINGNSYRAWERSCPHILPSNCSRMTVEQSFKIVCPCDQSQFNIINGTPLTKGINSVLLEYNVTVINNTTLKITNF